MTTGSVSYVSCTSGPPPEERRTAWRRLARAVLPVLLIGALLGALASAGTLPAPAKAALFCFGLTTVLWTFTRIDPAYVALAGTLLLVLTGGTEEEELYESLESHVIWLMIGAFVLGGAIQKVGLATRLTRFLARKAKTVGQLFWLMTAALLPLACVIPSTTGRAAVALPVFQGLSGVLEARAKRALALLIPTIILVSTISSLIGAGSHLIAVDLLQEITGQQVSFAQWLLWGLPFGAAASCAACWTVLRLFLTATERKARFAVAETERTKLSGREWKVLAITAAMIGGWMTESWHGLNTATVSIVGALVVTAPRLGAIDWREGLETVSWNLLIFVGAAIVMGEALVDTGAADWIVKGLIATTDIRAAGSTLFALLALSAITLTAHVYIISRSARAAALIPPLLYLAGPLQLNPVAVMFIASVGLGFCLTFPVSSKALLVYQEIEPAAFRPRKLMMLSAILAVAHIALMVAFYYGYWQWVGLSSLSLA